MTYWAAAALLAADVPGLDVLGGSVIGIVLLLSLFGYIWFKPSIDRLIADKEKAEAQRDALVDIYETKVIPVLSDVQARILPAMEKLASAGDAQKAAVDGLRAATEGYERQMRAVSDNLIRLTNEVNKFGSV
jgi:hypothetical protein